MLDARLDKPRTAWPSHIARPLKRRIGGGAKAGKPANVRTSGMGISSRDRAYIRRRLGMRLSKFSSAVERVTVRIEDVNGPRGGVDTLCKAKVVLTGLPSVVVQRMHQDTRAAVDGVLDATERAVRRVLGRRRSIPRRASGRRGRVAANR
jgi:ribosome-associated translation inhibitor RaiA